ncbi:hypothetical protein ZWY2020_039642 [Hordeum vulgare]|nr:hypothetical protein ZWY2020_039642 [Hordeum vulgare]
MEKSTKMVAVLVLAVLAAATGAEARNIKTTEAAAASKDAVLQPTTFPLFDRLGGGSAALGGGLPGSSGMPGFSLPGSGGATRASAASAACPSSAAAPGLGGSLASAASAACRAPRCSCCRRPRQEAVKS